MYYFQALIRPTFNIEPQSGTFEYFLSCVGNILAFVSNHDNWGDPLIPTPPGCVAMEAEGEEFVTVENRWLCD